jgi:hypothetical protein
MAASGVNGMSILPPGSKWHAENPDKIETWLNALEAAGAHLVQRRLEESASGPWLAMPLSFGAESVPRDLAAEWLGKKLSQEKQEQADREERMVRASAEAAGAASGSKRAAYAAAIAAAAAAFGTFYQASLGERVFKFEKWKFQVEQAQRSGSATMPVR